METKTGMKRSWLVQRLQRPLAGALASAAEAFSFGGGLKNGGLSDTAMEMLRAVLSFDYMGSSEFEWGAVPEALSRMSSRDDLTAWSFSIQRADAAPHWRDKDSPAPEGAADVFVLCPEAWRSEVESRIRSWAAEPFNDLKEQTRLSAALRPCDDWDGDVCGWLELDNGFWFFTDREMCDGVARLFGVPA